MKVVENRNEDRYESIAVTGKRQRRGTIFR
jgi:hypothetical protein